MILWQLTQIQKEIPITSSCHHWISFSILFSLHRSSKMRFFSKESKTLTVYIDWPFQDYTLCEIATTTNDTSSTVRRIMSVTTVCIWKIKAIKVKLWQQVKLILSCISLFDAEFYCFFHKILFVYSVSFLADKKWLSFFFVII